jgi:hypothetical protein
MDYLAHGWSPPDWCGHDPYLTLAEAHAADGVLTVFGYGTHRWNIPLRPALIITAAGQPELRSAVFPRTRGR